MTQSDSDPLQAEIDAALAETNLQDLDPDNPFFDQLTYMDPEEIPEYRSALSRIANKATSEISQTDRLMILRLPFAYIEEQNRLGLLTNELKVKVLEARIKIRRLLEAMPESPVAFYEPESYNYASSIQDNVLLGRISNSVAEGNERVTAAIGALLDEMGLTDDIFRMGLEFNIGSGGKRLSETQRQKLHLARAILKQPDILIVNQGLTNLGTREQEEIINMVLGRASGEKGPPFTVVWVPMNAVFAEMFERVIIFKDGELISDGKIEEIKNNNNHYAELIG